jgi:hypothetical protein
MTDKDYYEAMDEQLKTLDNEALQKLLDLTPQVSDYFNKILFDLLFTINNEQLQELIIAWRYLSNNDAENALNVFNIDVFDLFDDDYTLYDYDTLVDIADADLRANGLDAGALYWIKDLEINSHYNYFTFNGYMNGFNCYYDLIDAVSDYIDYTVIYDKIKDYFNN